MDEPVPVANPLSLPSFRLNVSAAETGYTTLCVKLQLNPAAFNWTFIGSVTFFPAVAWFLTVASSLHWKSNKSCKASEFDVCDVPLTHPRWRSQPNFPTLTVHSGVSQRTLWNTTACPIKANLQFGSEEYFGSAVSGKIISIFSRERMQLNRWRDCATSLDLITAHSCTCSADKRGAERMPAMNKWSVSVIDFPWKRKVKRGLLEALLKSLLFFLSDRAKTLALCGQHTGLHCQNKSSRKIMGPSSKMDNRKRKKGH